MGHAVRYTRPETRSTVTRIFVPTDEETLKQIRRLERLGYTIIDIVPPLREHRLALIFSPACIVEH